MRLNRVTRDGIEERFGADAIDEIEKWNDSKVDATDLYGVELDPEEEAVQAAVWENIVMHDTLKEAA